MRSLDMTLLAALMAIVFGGCPLFDGPSDEDVADSVASEVKAGGADVEADGSLPDTNEMDGSSRASDSAIPDLEGSPCIAVAPGSLHFGGKAPGTTTSLPLKIQSCADSPLEVSQVVLSLDSQPAFGLDLEALPTVPSDESPLVLAPGESVTVHVTYLEQCLEPPDDVDGPSPTPGAVVIHSNAPEAETIVPLEIAGVASIMPVAVIECQEGNQVVPGTVLHLIGDGSYIQCNEEGTITKWEWAVEQPKGSSAKFEPSNSVADPTFRVDVAGTYAFYLVVYDENNTPCCFPTEYEVVAKPTADIHIELFWHTPGDADETDEGPEAGSDLDLHLQHPFGNGYDLDGDGEPECWMDVDVNCFWFNLNPDWGEPGPENDPEMLLDDTDGAGPEVISFDNPEDMAYLVGVHYWNDHGFGDSWATVRVFVHGELAAQAEQVQLTDLDMWTAFRIDWPTGEVTLVTDNAGGYDIQSEFQEGYNIGDPETCGPF